MHGTKQAAKRFWLFLLSLLYVMDYKYNRVDPCVYYKWTDDGLLIWASWVDDLLNIGPKKTKVLESVEELKAKVECDDTGELKEYVGCKLEIDIEKQRMKWTQPVLLQSFTDEFKLPKENFETPAAPGTVLQAIEDGDNLKHQEQKNYRSGIGKLLHLMRLSRPDTLNAVREMSKFMGGANQAHNKAMHRILKYCADTPN